MKKSVFHENDIWTRMVMPIVILCDKKIPKWVIYRKDAFSVEASFFANMGFHEHDIWTRMVIPIVMLCDKKLPKMGHIQKGCLFSRGILF